MRILLIIVALLFTFNAKSQNSKTSFLKISIADSLSLPTKASLEISYYSKNSPEQQQLAIGRTIIVKKILKEPVLARLNLSWEGKKTMNLRFFLPVDTGELLIEGKNKVKFTFKNQQKLFEDFFEFEKQVSDLKNATAKKIKSINFENRQTLDVQKEIDSVDKHFSNLIDNHIYKRFINEQKDSFLAVIAVLEYAERPYEHQRKKFQTDSILMMYNSFNAEMKNLPSMQYLYEILLTENTLKHSPFPSLKFYDKNNQPFELTKLYGKYTLIDFWANWCTPCRAENPNLIDQYKKYKDKGLAILSVSIDKIADKHLWEEAISKDAIGLWPNFIDIDQKAKQILNIRFIPANYLIDNNGKIIAQDIIGSALNTKLGELFKK
jgi:thiol-disulfide isomerase/thioredoxin